MFTLLYTPAYLYELLRILKKKESVLFVCIFKIQLIKRLTQHPPVATGMRLQLAITKKIKKIYDEWLYVF